MIIAENEKAYKDKYGDSLGESWCCLSKKSQDDAISYIRPYTMPEIDYGVEYDRDSLLRILIGYRGKSLLEILLKDSLPSVKILVLEPDEAVFLAGCTLEDISSYIMDERITFIFGHRDNDFLKNILEKNLFDHNMNHIALSAVSEYRNNENAFVNEFRNLLTEMAWDINFRGNMRKRFDNLPYENYLYAIHTLNNNFTVDQLLEQIPTRDFPIIIVAAGPSLVKNCKDLKKSKGKALIIAITHAMKTLNMEGVVPDMVAVTDPQNMGFMDFDEMKSYYLLSNAYASRYDQQHYDGKIIYFGFNEYEGLFTTERIQGGIEPELSTGSVSTDVFSLFIEAGFRKFILVGQDLSYDEKGNTHAGNYAEQGYCERSGLFIETEGINGETVKTRFDWDRFRKYFENRIDSLPDLQVIDATEGGALIHGSIVMNLKDAISAYCTGEYPIDEWFAGIRKGSEDEKKEIKCWFDETIYRCTRLKDLLEEIVSINRSVSEALADPSLWNDDISASCKRYDVLYNVIMEGSDGELLRLYCRTEVQRYLENALIYEGDEKIVERMDHELSFFSELLNMSKDLIKYMEGLLDELL